MYETLLLILFLTVQISNMERLLPDIEFYNALYPHESIWQLKTYFFATSTRLHLSMMPKIILM